MYDEKQSSSPNETGRNRTSRLANGIVAPLPSELSPQRSLEFDATAHHADAHRKTPGSDRHGNVAMEITNEEADAGSVFRAKVHIEEIRAESKSDSMVYGKSALVERIGSHEVDLNRGRSIARSSPGDIFDRIVPFFKHHLKVHSKTGRNFGIISLRRI